MPDNFYLTDLVKSSFFRGWSWLAAASLCSSHPFNLFRVDLGQILDHYLSRTQSS